MMPLGSWSPILEIPALLWTLLDTEARISRVWGKLSLPGRGNGGTHRDDDIQRFKVLTHSGWSQFHFYCILFKFIY